MKISYRNVDDHKRVSVDFKTRLRSHGDSGIAFFDANIIHMFLLTLFSFKGL